MSFVIISKIHHLSKSDDLLLHLFKSSPDYGCYTFLHTDPTRGALQVFSRPTTPNDPNFNPDQLIEEVNGQLGVWINADPIEGALGKPFLILF